MIKDEMTKYGRGVAEIKDGGQVRMISCVLCCTGNNDLNCCVSSHVA